METIEEKIDRAIQALSSQITSKTTGDAALKFSQSILNLAHAKRRLEDNSQEE
jgi:hypothetical protein